MLFIYRNGVYQDCGLLFEDFLNEGLEGPSDDGDYALHLSTLFSPVRSKNISKFAALIWGDVGRVGLAALYKGLFYSGSRSMIVVTFWQTSTL